MARDDEIIEDCEITPTNTSDLNSSIVQKVTSLIPSSISKWFGKSQSRRRDSDSDDDSFILEQQPPTKRPRLPVNTSPSYPTPKLLNGSTNTCTVTKKTQVKTTELLNNIRPRKTFNRYNIPSPFPGYSNRSDEPQAGPSGLHLNYNPTKRTPEKSNGDKKTDSGGSTSGCSSMSQINARQSISPVAAEENMSLIGLASVNTSLNEKREKRDLPDEGTPKSPPRAKRFQIDRKQSPTYSPRTLFGDNSFTPNKSLASRRPSFNPSAFSGSSTLQDNTLTSERVINSPFYAGRTMFGGASSYPRQLLPSSKSTLRNSIQLKPSNEQAMKSMQNSASMSQTARRILDVLEQFNSPIDDTKRIPRLNLSSRDSRDQLKKLNQYQRTPYSRDILIKKTSPPIKGLTVPRVPTITEVINLKRQLQPSAPSPPKFAHKSTTAQPASTSTSTTTTEIPTPKPETKVSEPVSKNIFKPFDRKRENLKTQQQQDIEQIPESELSNIPLPITTLPKFDITPAMPPPQKKLETKLELLSTPKEIPKVNKIKPLWETNKIVEIKPKSAFKFASPIAIDKSTNSKNLISINNFKFSKPINVKDAEKVGDGFNFKCPSSSPVLKKKSSTASPSFKSIPEKSTLNNDQSAFAKAMNSWNNNNNKWECTKCSVKNNQNTNRCVVCTTLKPSTEPTKVVEPTAATQSTQKWDCKVCLIQNSEEKCKSCNGSKPGTKPIGIQNDLADKFAKKSNEWECPSCMVRNLNHNLTCLCCEAQRPSTNAVTVTKKVDPVTWQCGTCFKRNKEELSKCESCQESRKKENSNNNTLNSLFGKKSDEWECPSCMIRNASSILKCACCETPKPGTAPTSESKSNKLGSGGIQLPKTTEFKFGIDPSAAKKTDAPTISFGASTFNAPKPAPSPAASFSFGVTKTAEKKWECPSCMVNNNDEILKCVCCETPKPGTTPAPTKSLPKAGIVLEPTTQFKFGIDKVDPPKPETPKVETPKFTFGANSTPPKTSTVFSFGSNSNTPKDSGYKSNVGGSNQFGSPNFHPISSVTNSTSTTSTINFGGGKTSVASFGSPTSVNSTTSLPTMTVSSEIAKPAPFGSTPITFGVVTTTSTPVFGTSAVTTAAFGTPAVTTVSFGAPAASTTAFGNPATTTASFGTSGITFGATPAVTTASFGSTPVTTASFGTAPVTTSFGNFGATKPFAFSATKSEPFTFGSTEKPKPEESKPMFSMDKPTSWNSTPTPPFKLDPKPETSTFNNNPFGSTPTPNFGAKSQNFGGFGASPAPSFGATQSTSFGATTQAPAFGSSTTFGATQSFGTSSTPSFGAVATQANTNPSFGAAVTQANTNPSFGAAAPVFGSNSWGQNQTNNSSAFSFGSTPSQPQQPQNKSLFSFGNTNQGQIGQSTTNAAPGAFAFGGNNNAQSQQAPAQQSIPSFNPNTKPVFNFTSGAPTPVFSAQLPTDGSGQPMRRIKKAVRRTRVGP